MLQFLAPALMVAAIAIAPSGASRSELSKLTLGQSALAACMLSVVKATRDVSDAKLSVVTEGEIYGAAVSAPRVFIDYKYRYRFDGTGQEHPWSVATRPMQEEITQFLTPTPSQKFQMLGFSGIAPVGAPEAYYNDHNGGMPGIVSGWASKCGVPVGALSI